MKCPSCGSSKMSKVYWVKEDGEKVRRYRECGVCNQRYVTEEHFARKLNSPGKKE